MQQYPDEGLNRPLENLEGKAQKNADANLPFSHPHNPIVPHLKTQAIPTHLSRCTASKVALVPGFFLASFQSSR